MEHFWSESIWLPPNATWASLETNGDLSSSHFEDLYKPIPLSLLVLLLRFFTERVFLRPLGSWLGLKSSRRKAPTNDLLEEYYSQSKRLPTAALVRRAAERHGDFKLPKRKVEQWLRIRRSMDRPLLLDKFSETGWICLYYTSVFIFGVSIMSQKSWVWDIRNCWYNYPYHPIDSDVWWYYMVELSFYWSLLFSQFFDVKRKDFWEMFIHHLTTIALMGFSWTCNLTRVGTLVLVIHDIADIFLGLAKLSKYANYQTLCDFLFVCFALVWITTRIGVYPCWILYSTTIEAPQMLEMFPAYYIFNVLLSILLVLNVTWTYFILKIVHQSIFVGKIEKDSRSESEDDDENEEEEDSSSNSECS
eukprot:TRINITY_DN3283_c0_g3_i2.p1 TRINITY_DN3283_c0_g3~~TRINITY_DN3283_c0_g3_i2.p1  ORF type:complete len:361 (-),score=84.35 TRINITY_DN3283_c0_g3_i2:250-1332(-)